MIRELIPAEWAEELCARVPSSVFDNLEGKLRDEYAKYTVYPAIPQIFNAIQGVKPTDIKVVILGQDPYHERGQAHGLSFSVPDGQPLPPSLRNVYQELHDDLGVPIAKSGNLERWKQQGVLLLNTVLTVREHQANAHKDIGWEVITAAILDIVMETNQDVVFILWGRQAKDVFAKVYASHPRVHPGRIHALRSAHPSPLSAHNGFFGSKPFSVTNDILRQCNMLPINW